MHKKTVFGIVIAIAILGLGTTVTAGGTPPGLTWQTLVTASPIGCVSTGQSVHSPTIDSSGNIYVYCGYSGSTQAIIKYDTNGLKVWQKQITNPTPTQAVGIAADSAGHIALAYCDGTTANKVFKIHSQSDGAQLYSFAGTGVFTTTQCGVGGNDIAHMVDALTLNTTSVQYLVGDSSLQYSFVCHWNLLTNPCSKKFEVASLDRGPSAVTSGGPYIQAFVSHDPSISGGGGKTWRTNLDTGAEQTGINFGNPQCKSNTVPWYDVNAGANVYMLHTKGCTLLTTNRPTYTKLTTTTFSVSVSEPDLTEPLPVIPGVTINQWQNKVSTGYLDGENRGFYCGRAITDTNEDYASIIKFNLDTNTQVWNITTNELNPDGAGQEFVNQCILDKDGALITLTGHCTTGTSSGCSIYLRKYAGAGLGRTLQTAITPPTPTVSVPANPIQDAVQYTAESWGMDEETAGWLFGLAIVGLIVFRVKNGHPILIIIMAIIAIGLAVKLALFPVWLLLVIVFAILAFAGSALFTKEEGTE